MVLVGTQSDLREDGKTILQLRQNKEQPIQEHEAKKLAQSLGNGFGLSLVVYNTDLPNFINSSDFHEYWLIYLCLFLGCELYIECSSLTQKNLKEVFDNAIVSGLTQRRNREKKMNKKKKKLCILL